MAAITFNNAANNATSTLDGAITAVATTLDVQSGDESNFPAANFMLCIVDSSTLDANGEIASTTTFEIVKVTSVATNTFTITRAQESTSASAFDDGDLVFHCATAQYITDLNNASQKFDASGNIASDIIVADDINLIFGTDSDIQIKYDEVTDNRLEFHDGTNLLMSLTDADPVVLAVGVSDTTSGAVHVLGGATGIGGVVRAYNPADDDTTQDYYELRADGDMFLRAEGGTGGAKNLLRYYDTTAQLEVGFGSTSNAAPFIVRQTDGASNRN